MHLKVPTLFYTWALALDLAQIPTMFPFNIFNIYTRFFTYTHGVAVTVDNQSRVPLMLVINPT